MTTSTVAANTMASKLDVPTHQAQQRADVTEVADATGPTGGEGKHPDGEDQPHGDLASQNMVASPWQSLGLRWRHSAGAHRWPRSSPRLCD